MGQDPYVYPTLCNVSKQKNARMRVEELTSTNRQITDRWQTETGVSNKGNRENI